MAEVQRLAGALEDVSEHPIAKAIAAAARAVIPSMQTTSAAAATDDALPAVDGFSNHDGRGVTGVVDGRAVLVGRRSWLEQEWSIQAPADLLASAEAAEADGQTPVWVAWDGAARGVIVVADTIKDTSAQGHRAVPHPRASTDPAHR